ncbi:MAG: hypothetical protein MUC65_11220 [Pontiellaceae bacterium]|nr:hypothetical protein [Pontiellaceae bacterium]
MNTNTRKTGAGQSGSETTSVIEELLQQGAREMLLKAIEAEVAEYIDRHSHLRDESGHRLVVRNGHLPEREILTGIKNRGQKTGVRSAHMKNRGQVCTYNNLLTRLRGF